MTYLLDTSIVIGLLREMPTIVKKYIQLPSNRSKVITVYSLTELFEGIYKISNPKKRDAQLKILNLIINYFTKIDGILALTIAQAEKYAQLKIALDKKGTPIPVIDLLIGTIAIERQLILLTTDHLHFQKLKAITPQLKVEFW